MTCAGLMVEPSLSYLLDGSTNQPLAHVSMSLFISLIFCFLNLKTEDRRDEEPHETYVAKEIPKLELVCQENMSKGSNFQDYWQQSL